MLCLTACLLMTLHRLNAISAVNLVILVFPHTHLFPAGVWRMPWSVVCLQDEFNLHLAVRWCGLDLLGSRTGSKKERNMEVLWNLFSKNTNYIL